MSDKILASDYFCARCEANGVKTIAELFICLEDIGAKDLTPLCKRCKNEWVNETFIEEDGSED
jgi:hypothetical protein